MNGCNSVLLRLPGQTLALRHFAPAWPAHNMHRTISFLILYVATTCCCETVFAQESSTGGDSVTASVSNPELALQIDPLIAAAIDEGETPGAVVCIGSQTGIRFLKAYGHRQVRPSTEPMTVDTVFDLASLTKPVATATSIMLLIEAGNITPDQTATSLWPEFNSHDKDGITVRQLLTHTGGLIPDNALSDYQQGRAVAMEKICQLKLSADPGSRFIYSDVGFIVLGELVESTSKQPLQDFTAARIFKPLGMSQTRFVPDQAQRVRCAATEKQGDTWLKGQVHDPRAAAMGGAAGHAGLFSTAGDLAIFARMLLGKGTFNGVKIMSPETFELMTGRVEVPGGFRGLGWDMQTGYSTNRGATMSDRAFGHGGFTGTALWIDPDQDLFVIFLSTRLHPDGKGSVNRLAGRIGTIAADAARAAHQQQHSN